MRVKAWAEAVVRFGGGLHRRVAIWAGFLSACLLGAMAHAAPTNAPVFIRATQIGGLPGQRLSALAFSEAPLPRRFEVVDEASGAVVHRGRATPLRNERWGKFEHHAELNFKPRQPGRYRIRVAQGPSHCESLPFAVAEGLFASLADELLDFMRQQRCGYNPWLDAHCHQADGRTAYGPLPPGTPLDARGGWHDAGDLLKYLLTSCNATAQMLLAWQLGAEGRTASGKRRPIAFKDERDALGRPGPNGLADLLDEARWGLDWMLKLHPAPDQLYHQVADDRDHAGSRLPQNDKVDYGWGPGGARVVYFADGQPQGLGQYKSASTGVANLAGRYAAAMALAYQIWKDDPQHAAFAARCLQAGREVYELGRAKEGVQQGNSYKAPYRYEESTWTDDMEWGAAELFRATGERRYLEEAKHYAALAADTGWFGREQVGHYEFYPFMNAGHFRLYDLVEARFQKQLAGWYRAGLDRCVAAAQRNPWRVGAPFVWCSNNLLVALVTQALMYERMTGQTGYREFALRQRDWLLGRNPWGTTMFTEIGAEFPTDVHLQTTHWTKRRVRGGLVDGPVYERIFKSLRGVSITLPDPLEAFHGAAVYHDDIKDYSTNEPTMDGTASAILMFVLCELAR
ncbi:MAG: glycoside hydrolase family 9 protein [Verrucomicrobiae bacterium]|nr:glycoside hydrolase family 9 protein [Verrucomicrobiae bacterium]